MRRLKTERFILVTIIGLMFLFVVSACQGSVASNKGEATQEVISATLTPVPETSDETDIPLLDPAFGFKQALVLALNTQPRNYEEMITLMGDSFEVLIWYGNGEQLVPTEAVNALQTFLLPPENTLSFEEIDIAALMGIDPHDYYNNPEIVEFMFTRGWGETGTDEALLVIGQKPDGAYYWSGILLANGAFAQSGGPGITALDMFREHLIQAWIPITRDLAYLESIMVDPFPVADVFALHYESPLPPTEALARMQADGLMSDAEPSGVTNDLEYIKLQTNIDPRTHFGQAVDAVLVGQTSDGTSNVLLIIGEDEMGEYNFMAVGVVPVGFKTPVDAAREQILQAWMPIMRDLVALEGLMVDPFYIGGATAYLYEPMTPAEAITQMQADTVLANNVDPNNATNDLESIKQGTNFDPSAAIPNAADYVWVGLSDDGQFNVILVIGPDDAGDLKLIQVFMIPADYQPPNE